MIARRILVSLRPVRNSRFLGSKSSFAVFGVSVCLYLSDHTVDCSAASSDNSLVPKGYSRDSRSRSSGDGNGDNDDDDISKIIKQIYPYLGRLGFSGAMGFTCGYALKKVGEKAAYSIGVMFITIQTLQYLGYITIDYGKVQDDVEKSLDVNNDGKLDVNDFLIIWRELKAVLTASLPSASGFVTGMAMGMYF